MNKPDLVTVSMNETIKRLTLKKKEFDGRKFLYPNDLKELEEWLDIELTYSSNAISGNSLTRQETAEIIKNSVK